MVILNSTCVYLVRKENKGILFNLDSESQQQLWPNHWRIRNIISVVYVVIIRIMAGWNVNYCREQHDAHNKDKRTAT
jgi:hypothetical protein